MCAVMNGVSDLNLALAVHSAGAMPGLMITGTDRDNQLDHALTEFVKCTGYGNIVLQLNYGDLTNVAILKLIKQHQVSHVELFGALDSLGMTTKEEFDYINKYANIVDDFDLYEQNKSLF